MRLLDFQKQILPPENFNIQDYLEHNGLYRYNTLFYFHIIPKDQNLSFDSTQSEENIEETLPTRPITRTFSRNLETESQTPPATQSQSPKRQTGN